jgi:hypothetical protein
VSGPSSQAGSRSRSRDRRAAGGAGTGPGGVRSLVVRSQQHGVAGGRQPGGGLDHPPHDLLRPTRCARHGPIVAAGDLHDRHRRGVSRERADQFGTVAAQDDDAGQPRGHRGDQRIDVGTLEQTAGDPHDAGVGGQRGAGRVRVGGLAVVDVVDPADGRHPHVAVRAAAEAGQPAAHRLRRNPGGPAQRGCGEGVDQVVRAGDLQPSGLEQQLAGGVGGERAVDQRAGPHAELARGRFPERDRHRMGVPGHERGGHRIAGVGHGDRSVLEDARLRVAVGGERAVPVGVVVGDVEHGGRRGRQRRRPVQLEARELHGQGVVGRGPVVPGGGDHLDEGPADVARGHRTPSAGEQDRLEHGDRRRLAVGAGDGEPRSRRAGQGPDPPGQLGLADHLHSAGGGVGQQRVVRPPAR